MESNTSVVIIIGVLIGGLLLAPRILFGGGNSRFEDGKVPVVSTVENKGNALSILFGSEVSTETKRGKIVDLKRRTSTYTTNVNGISIPTSLDEKDYLLTLSVDGVKSDYKVDEAYPIAVENMGKEVDVVIEKKVYFLGLWVERIVEINPVVETN